MVQVVRTPRGGFGLGCRWCYGDAPTRRLSKRPTERSEFGFDLFFRAGGTEAEAGRALEAEELQRVAGEQQSAIRFETGGH